MPPVRVEQRHITQQLRDMTQVSVVLLQHDLLNLLKQKEKGIWNKNC